MDRSAFRFRNRAGESIPVRWLLTMGDVVLIDLPEQGGEVEAKVVEPIHRTKTTVRVSLRVAGREDFVKEWPLGEKITVLRGP